MLKNTVIAATVIYVLCMIGAMLAPVQRPEASRPALPDVASDNDEDRPQVARPLQYGFALAFHHPADLQVYLDAVDELARMGFNAILISTPIYQENGASDTIVRYETTEDGDPAVGFSPTREQLATLLEHCRRARLRVTLMPIVLPLRPQQGEWRGKFRPSYWADWWLSYREQMDFFIDLANETGVDTLSVGSELISTESQTDEWLDLIAHTRERFKGRLIYSTNWDSYHRPQFWYALDAIGVNGYWKLTEQEFIDPDAAEPPGDTPMVIDETSKQQLIERWNSIRLRLMAFAQSQHRPILLTEVGYPSLPSGARDPWNYVGNGERQAVRAQLAGYTAFFSAWEQPLGAQNDPNLFAGVFFYKWDPYYSGGPDDTGYGVRGKPSLKVITDWLQSKKAMDAAPPPTPKPSETGDPTRVVQPPAQNLPQSRNN